MLTARNFGSPTSLRKNKNLTPESLGGGSVRMVLTVDDPDAAFGKAVAAGATVVHHSEIGKPLES